MSVAGVTDLSRQGGAMAGAAAVIDDLPYRMAIDAGCV